MRYSIIYTATFLLAAALTIPAGAAPRHPGGHGFRNGASHQRGPATARHSRGNVPVRNFRSPVRGMKGPANRVIRNLPGRDNVNHHRVIRPNPGFISGVGHNVHHHYVRVGRHRGLAGTFNQWARRIWSSRYNCWAYFNGYDQSWYFYHPRCGCYLPWTCITIYPPLVTTVPVPTPHPYPSAGQVPYANAGQIPYPNAGQVPYPNAGQVPYPNAGQIPYPNAGQFPAPNQGSQPGNQFRQVPFFPSDM